MHTSWSWRLRQRSIIWIGMVTSINSIDQVYVATELCHVTNLWRFPEARRVVEDCHECLPLYTNNLGSCCDTYLMPRCVLEEKLREVPRRYHRRLPLPYKRRTQGAEEGIRKHTQPPQAPESLGRIRSWSLLFPVVVLVVTSCFHCKISEFKVCWRLGRYNLSPSLYNYSGVSERENHM